MSALGQKQTYAVQHGMSALPPIATSIAFFGMSALGQKGTSCTRRHIAECLLEISPGSDIGFPDSPLDPNPEHQDPAVSVECLLLISSARFIRAPGKSGHAVTRSPPRFSRPDL